MDTLLLCFSNSPTAPLATLTDEDRTLFDILSPREARGHFKIVRESYATAESVIQRLETYQQTITVFHFAGHAGKEGLLLDDAWARVGGLAALLARCPNLKFICLNGCATHTLVKTLLEQPIKAGIVATQAAVGDTQASQFSTYLYKYLNNQYSLSEAVQRAKEALNVFTETRLQTRGLGEEIGPLDAENWVFITPSSEAEHWSLPTHSQRQSNDYVPNKRLIESTFSALQQYDATLLRRFEDEALGDPVIDDKIKSKLIIESLSYPLAEPLRRILCPPITRPEDLTPKPDKSRIHAYQNLFDSVISLLISTLLAQIRDLYLQTPREQIQISDLPLTILKGYLKGERTAFQTILQTMREILKANQIPYYVEELETLVSRYYDPNAKTLADSLDFFVDLKARFPYRGDQTVNDVDCLNICEIGEENLSHIAENSGFWVRYNLESYKNIRVIKYFRKPPQYKHERVRLKSSLVDSGADTTMFYREDRTPSAMLWESQSVLLVKSALEVGKIEYLNLSPFILDKNVFAKRSDNVFDLHIFESYSSVEKTLIYRRIGRPGDEPLRIQIQANDRQTEADFGVLREQFNTFTTLLFNLNYWEI
ncbi:MAG: CHAT domain-containing protein [Spirosomataceae bacterium]